MSLQITKDNVCAAIISLAALIGMVDAFFLLLEFVEVLLHPGLPTPCTVNTLVSCTLTVQGPFGHYFPGIPNPMWGMLWYSGLACYGLTRLARTQFSAAARRVVGVVIVLGLLFSYRLYLASVLQLGGVCPFCLISTTVSTLIALAFVVDDRGYSDPILGRRGLRAAQGFLLFSFVAFVCGLPLFLISGLRYMPNPMLAITHWSFPLMFGILCVMATGQLWAWRQIKP